MPPSKRSRPTMLDVAKLSGVSYQTVSRVINEHPYVSDDTRQRVQEAIDTLGYRPNKVATRLKAKHSKTIAIILYGGWLHGPVQVGLNIELAAKTSGFDVIQANITKPQKQLTEAIRHMKDWAVDGILAIVPVQSLPFQEIQTIADGTPFVLIDCERTSEIPSLVIDDYSGTKQLVEHLISLGHRDFCEITGPLDWFSAQIRHQTCHEVCREHDVPPPLHIEANWTPSGGYQAMRRLLEKKQHFTALISANDSMAFGAIRALHQAGLSVPEDVSIVGYDDIPEAAYFVPSLTTARQNFMQLGINGFEYLMQVMDEQDTPYTQQIIPSELIVRESTISL